MGIIRDRKLKFSLVFKRADMRFCSNFNGQGKHRWDLRVIKNLFEKQSPIDSFQ